MFHQKSFIFKLSQLKGHMAWFGGHTYGLFKGHAFAWFKGHRSQLLGHAHCLFKSRTFEFA